MQKAEWPECGMRPSKKLLEPIIPEVGHDIAVSFKNIHDLQRVAFIAEEDHIILERETASIRAKFGAGVAQCAG
jgi:hypothetical protein